MSAPTTLEQPLQPAHATTGPQNSLTPRISRQTSILAAVFVGSAAVMLFLDWHLRFDLSDDAYIHLRIAHNLIRTGHPYFNLGQRYQDLRFYPLLRSESAADLSPVWGSRTLHVLVKRAGVCPASQLDQALSTILQPQPQLAGAEQ